MIQVFCGKRGSGKTKALIGMANDKVSESKGHIVYIDGDKRPLLQLDKSIRFVDAGEFDLKKGNSFYGFLCGIISEDYDIDSIFVDGLSNIVDVGSEDAAHLFSQLEKISIDKGVDFYININEMEDMPDIIKKYVA
ncbi:MAG: hypothetical protein H6Q58_130 [Firmicutes bacterium]|nr:hypothetical protein [Bacillota bacterium]